MLGRLPLLLLLCLALHCGHTGGAQAAPPSIAASSSHDPDASHPALVRCSALEADEASDDEEAEACLTAAGADASLPCAVRALALVELSRSLTSKKKLPVLRRKLEEFRHRSRA